MKKTVVLSSRENFVWLSMQEIIPTIERNWLASAEKSKHKVIIRNVDDQTLTQLMPDILDADNIVIACFTVKLINIAKILRADFGSDARLFIYLHNQATIACWPLHEWGLAKYLREDDIFLSTAKLDANAMPLSFKKCRVEIIPFTFSSKDLEKNEMNLNKNKKIPFVYVGRLSAQKNLHTLLYSYQIFVKKNPTLQTSLSIYGADDNLGSPNMQMPSRGYRDYLENLCSSLGLKDHVIFKGHQDRDRIQRKLSTQRHIFVSPSLHSDENFGMAPFRSLCGGNLAVLSKWGGYADFCRYFPGQLFSLKVHASKIGPWIEPTQLATCLRSAAKVYIEDKRRKPRAKIPAYYAEKTVAKKLLFLALQTKKMGPPLRKTTLAKRILKKHSHFGAGNRHSTKIFTSYSDPDSAFFFKSYGMKIDRNPPNLSSNYSFQCFPWVSIKKSSLLVCDPHRGDMSIRLPKNAPLRSRLTLSDWIGTKIFVNKKTAVRLIKLGLMHAS